MRSIMGKLIIILLILVVSQFMLYSEVVDDILVAGEGEKKVIATGYGDNFEKALEQTMRNAVEKVVGSYITSSTLIENNQLIEDKILSLSRGFVKDYKIISESETDNEVKLIASVIITGSQVIETMKASGIEVEFEGQKMFQQFQSFNKQVEDEYNLVKEILNDLPRAPIVDYTIEVGGPVQVNDFYEIPIVIKGELNNNFSNEMQNLKNFMEQSCFEMKNFADIAFTSTNYIQGNRHRESTNYTALIERRKDRKRKHPGFFSTVKRQSNTELKNIASQYGFWADTWLHDDYDQQYKTILDRDRYGNYSVQGEDYYDIFDKQYSPFIICSLDDAKDQGKRVAKIFDEQYNSPSRYDFRDGFLLNNKDWDVTMYKFLNKNTFFFLGDYIQNILLDVGFEIIVKSKVDHKLDIKLINFLDPEKEKESTTLVFTNSDNNKIFFKNSSIQNRNRDGKSYWRPSGFNIYIKKGGNAGYYKEERRTTSDDSLYGRKIQNIKIPFAFENKKNTPDGIFSCLTHESGGFASQLRFLPTETIFPESDRSYIEIDNLVLIIPADIFSNIEKISISPLPVNPDIPLGGWQRMTGRGRF